MQYSFVYDASSLSVLLMSLLIAESRRAAEGEGCVLPVMR